MPEPITPALLTVRPMDAWYAMNDEHGRPQGYARLVTRKATDGTIEIEWQLRLAFPQGTYEEDRVMVLDRDLRLLSASYFDGECRSEGRRDGRAIRVTTSTPQGPPAQATVEAPDDAWTGLDFVLAAAVPQRQSVVLKRTGLNEAQGFADLGPVTFHVMGPEKLSWQGRELDVWRIERESTPRGKTVRLPVWVDEDGRIVQVDWGGGNLMVLSPSPTSHLFKPSTRPGG